MRTSSLAAAAVAIASFVAPAVAYARDAGADDITALEKSLSDEAAALSTTDCAAACRALQSIRRAAEKICELDQGTHCSTARAKAEEATRRVRDACPGCAYAQTPTPAPRDDEKATTGAAKKGAPATELETPPRAPAAASSPQAESKRGGCAGCATSAGGGGTGSELASVALLSIAAAVISRARRRRLRRDRTTRDP